MVEDKMERTSSAFARIVQDNETATRQALDSSDFVQAYLLLHALLESLLRQFLNKTRSNLTFEDLIKKYEALLRQNDYPTPSFVKELRAFNQRRNRIIHNLWKNGFTHTNKQAESAATGAYILYGLFIDWLETFDSKITEYGFTND